MPNTYEYECEHCGIWWTHTCRMADKPSEIPCECGHMAESRMSVPIIAVSRDKPKAQKPSGSKNKLLYHQQAGIYYTDYKDLERKAKARGLEPIGTYQDGLDWIDSADTESFQKQEAKRQVKEYRQYCANNGIEMGGKVTEKERVELSKSKGKPE